MIKDNVVITNYAPVYITTLNRYEHFVRCVESLERNPLAKDTEIFISVDFPPSEKYVAGHKKIVSYLKSREFEFKKTYLYFQESNLGVPKNAFFLKKIVYEKYDRVIILEDDNELSPNFLEYMNKALEYGKDKDNIMAVTAFSGYYILPRDISGTAFKTQAISWGVGMWRDKEKKLLENISNEWVEDIARDWKKLYKIYKNNRITFINFCQNFVFRQNPRFYNDGKIDVIDMIRNLYMIFNDLYVIVPTVSKLRNYGSDGSGVNGGLHKEQMNIEATQPIDRETEYNFVLETEPKICKKVQKYIRNKRKFSYSKMEAIKTLLYCFYFTKLKKHEV